MEKTEEEITILVCGSSSYYSAVAVSETDTTTDVDVVTAVSGSSYYFSAAADLEMDADAATEILSAANLFCKAGHFAPSFLISLLVFTRLSVHFLLFSSLLLVYSPLLPSFSLSILHPAHTLHFCQ